MHENDDKLRVLRLVTPDEDTDSQPSEFWGYDDGREAGYRVGYRVGRADAVAHYERLMVAEAGRVRLWVTWGLVLAFAIGGVFGVGVCAHLWPLIEAGVIP